MQPTSAFDQVARFLQGIGITVRLVPGSTGFLPGVAIKGESILVDAADDALAGEVLHEAGHIAVIPSRFRPLIDDDVDSSVMPAVLSYLDANALGLSTWPEDPICRACLQCGEQEAIAWSYAAALAAGVDTMLPFSQGFDDHGDEVHALLARGAHCGIHGLVAAGMADTPRRGGFPKMRRWMQA